MSSNETRISLLGIFSFLLWSIGVTYLIQLSLAPTNSIAVIAVGFGIMFLSLRLGFSLSKSLARKEGHQNKVSPHKIALEKYTEKTQKHLSEIDLGRLTENICRSQLKAQHVTFLWNDDGWHGVERKTLGPSHELSKVLVEDREHSIWEDLSSFQSGVGAEFIETHKSQLLIPLINRNRLVGLISIGGMETSQKLKRFDKRFLLKIQELSTGGILYTQMHRQTSARVEVDKQVELAAAVQGAFVPGKELFTTTGFSVCGVYEPASKCGGDWWSLHHLPDGRSLVLVGDVTGHGIAAAMVTAAAKGCYDVAERLMGANLDVQELLSLLNASVCRAGGGEFFMTSFATVIDTEGGKCDFANAGHTVPYLCRPNENDAMSLEVLVARGNPLGTDEISAGPHKAKSKTIMSGDILLWYTDGIVECLNPKGDQYGDRRFQRILKKLKPHWSCEQVRDHIIDTVTEFRDGVPPDDDITLVVGKIA